MHSLIQQFELRASDGAITMFDPPGATFTNATSINFVPKIIVPMLVDRREVDYAKLRGAAWRLIVKHRERILALALELARVKKMSNKRLIGFVQNRLAVREACLAT